MADEIKLTTDNMIELFRLILAACEGE